MQREEISQKVRAILCSKLGLEPEQVENEHLQLGVDLGADSLDQVELVMEFEKEFNISVSDEKASEISTIEHCINTVSELLEKKL